MRERKGYQLRIGHLLIEEGVISQRQLAIGLAAQFETSCIDLIGTELDLGILKRIPTSLLDKSCFIPILIEEDGLKVAIDDIPDPGLFTIIEEALHCPVRYVIAPSVQVQKIWAYCERVRRRGAAGSLTRTAFSERFFTLEDTEADREAVSLGPQRGSQPTEDQADVPAAKDSRRRDGELIPEPLGVDALDNMAPGPQTSGGKTRQDTPESAEKSSSVSPQDVSTHPPSLRNGASAARGPGGDSRMRQIQSEDSVPQELSDFSVDGSLPEEPAVVAEESWLVRSHEDQGASSGDALDPLDQLIRQRAKAPENALDTPVASPKGQGTLPPRSRVPSGATESRPPQTQERTAATGPKPAVSGPTRESQPTTKEPAAAGASKSSELSNRSVTEVAAATWPQVGAALIRSATTPEITTVPPISQVSAALPLAVQTILSELSSIECHSLTIVPFGAGADVMITDEEGSHLVRHVGQSEYREILTACLKLLLLPPADPTEVIRQKVEVTFSGEPFVFRLWVLPSSPPTLSFSVSDRESWTRRRQVYADSMLIDALVHKAQQRRGLLVVTAASPHDLHDTFVGILSSLRRAHLRVAVFSDKVKSRLREISHLEVAANRTEGLLAQETLLFIAESGIDVLAFQLALNQEQLRKLVSIAAMDASLLVTMREPHTLDAVASLVRAQIPLETISTTLETVLSIHRIPKLCPFCRRAIVLADSLLPPALKGSKLVNAVAFESTGCQLCAKTGVRGWLSLYEVLNWDREKAPPDTLALDRRALMKRCYELGLIRPMTLEARKALLAGEISLNSYMSLLGVAAKK